MFCTCYLYISLNVTWRNEIRFYVHYLVQVTFHLAKNCTKYTVLCPGVNLTHCYSVTTRVYSAEHHGMKMDWIHYSIYDARLPRQFFFISHRISSPSIALNLFIPIRILIKKIALHQMDLYPLSGNTSNRKNSWSLEAPRFGFRLFQSLWHLAGTSAAALPRCLSNVGTIKLL